MDRRASERGFTLPEVLITVVLIGIVCAIAIPSWFGLVEARRVESAANQLAGDLRLAHSRATNQIGTKWSVTLHQKNEEDESAGPDYEIGAEPRTLPDGVRITSISPASQTVLTFSGGGGVKYEDAEAQDEEIQIQSGSTTKKITINAATSSVKVEE